MNIKAVGKRLDRHMKARANRLDGNSFITSGEGVVETWAKGDVRFFIVKSPVSTDVLNGYCMFPRRPVKELGMSGILTYVPVHGGITWAQPSLRIKPTTSRKRYRKRMRQARQSGPFCYGFDCAHGDDMDDSGPTFEERLAAFQESGDAKDIMVRFKKRSLKWLRDQCEQMGNGILAAVRYEAAYLAAENDNKARGIVLNSYHEYLTTEGLGTFRLQDNYGAMLRVICGEL